MPKPTCKLGLIGCGSIAQAVHLNILTRLSGVELVALAEPDPQRQEAAKRQAPSAIAYTDYRDLLQQSAIDGVVICLPSALHAEAAIAALDQGKHVYLEKPIAVNTQEAQAVIAAWQRAGTIGMIGFNYRFSPQYRAAKQVIQSGQLGKLVSARSVFSYPVGTAPVWKQKRASGGGILLDLGLHDIDLARFLFDAEVQTVAAEVRSHHYEDDTAALQFQLSNGLLFQLFTSMSTIDEARWEIYGQNGKLIADRYRDTQIQIISPHRASSRRAQLSISLQSALRSLNWRKMIAPTLEPSYEGALAEFVDAVLSGRPAYPNFTDGLRALAVIEAAELAAQSGSTISLTEATQERSSSNVIPAL
ncbi:Gfo/Idh/MocA family oxidoreductase [Oscillatoria sp. CS-180]|uniref:Gfo/Idh/MocA family protein n=1 Tax=Oscillatoria sp. CS-180 TaxID=3021720 RepID=UPI00232D8F6B|nr:Gfo/Idh/MocA family oxidoreductase [Oscillatoria sp. CS-180]MDB9529341.1 Gfo/Idh/MocA family oxidoreductase [Oscillatoria sp. CS-180]